MSLFGIHSKRTTCNPDCPGKRRYDKENPGSNRTGRSYNGKAVVIKLQNADYNLHRESSSQILYHISNTASEKENPDQTKHIGLWLKDLKNVTIDGQGSPLRHPWLK